MKFRANIIFSLVMHVTVFTAALALAGKDAVLRFPERFTMVTLFEQLDARKTKASGTEKKKEPERTAREPVKRLREASPPEATPTTQRQDKEPPAAVPQSKPVEDGAGLTVSSSAADITATLKTSRVSGSSQGGMQLAIPGKAAAQSGPEGRQNKNGQGGFDAANAIRAAIERAKSYPQMARKRGIEGTATTEFTINSRGIPENIRILKSSGSDILDAAAKNTVLKASPFPQVSGGIEVPITFRIDR